MRCKQDFKKFLDLPLYLDQLTKFNWIFSGPCPFPLLHQLGKWKPNPDDKINKQTNGHKHNLHCRVNNGNQIPVLNLSPDSHWARSQS